MLVGPDLVLAGADVGGAALPEAMARQSPRLLAIGNHLPRPRVRWVETPRGPMVEELFGHAGRRQPLFHLDGFVSLAGQAPDGRERILVGDSRMAVRDVDDARLPLAGQSLADELDEIAAILAAMADVEVLRNPLVIAALDDRALPLVAPDPCSRSSPAPTGSTRSCGRSMRAARGPYASGAGAPSPRTAC